MIFTITPAFSQSMNSPYSIYGIGDMDNRLYGRTSGMAGSGIALQSSAYIINSNPAAITGLERSFFVLNASATGKFVTYNGNTISTSNASNQDLWIRGISLAVKINKFWATNAGLSQFSNVSYKLSGTRTSEGSNQVYTSYQEGEGGLNDYYWTNAIQLGKKLSLGVKTSVLAGPITRTETIYDNTLLTTITTKQRDYIGDLRFQLGLFYKTPVGKKWEFSFGERYSPLTKLSSDREITVSQDGTSIVEDRFIKTDHFTLPNSYATGIALTHNKKTTFTVEHVYENWGSLGIKGSGWKYNSNNRVAAGVEFSQIKQMWNMPVEKRFYQLGVFYNKSYLEVRNNQIREYGFTAGMGGRLGNGLLYSVSGEMGMRGSAVAGLIREQYVQFTFTLSYRDFLFSKGRKYN